MSDPKAASVRISGATFARIKHISLENRLKIVNAIDVLADGWDLLSPEQQAQAIRRPVSVVTHPAASRGRRRHGRAPAAAAGAK
jgi:hypothetical protein